MQYRKMLSCLVLAATLVPLSHTSTMAATATTAASTLPHWKDQPKTRKEQIDRLKAMTAALEKMSDANWNAMQQQKAAHRAQVIERRKAILQRRAAAQAQRSVTAPATPASVATPAPAPAVPAPAPR